MLKAKEIILVAGLLGSALADGALADQAATPGSHDRQMVFEVHGLACPAVAGLG
jgi:hypothetical protein